jgi:GNAT superfamily N-acetyltransferase
MPAVISVTRTYLEMRSRDELLAAPRPDAGARIERVEFCPVAFFRFLYAEVGRNHRWIDRLRWSDAEIRGYLDAGDVTLYVLYVAGAPAGYVELRRHADRSVEIAYFGLLPEYIGRGLGGHLLTRAVELAWGDGAARVWLHTCTLDHPSALPNYLKRGFRPIRQETYQIAAG